MAVRQITTRLAVDGEQEFKREMSAVGSAMKTLKSEMSLVDAEFRGQANTMEALRKKHDVLSREYDQQAEKVKALEQAVRDASDAYGEDSDKVQKYQQQLNRAKASLIGLNDELQENAKYLQEAEDSADGCAKSIDGYGKEIKDAADATASLNGAGGGKGGISDLIGQLRNLKNMLIGGAVITALKATGDAIIGIVDDTAEYRQIMGTLEVSSQAAGYTAEQTAESFEYLYGVLGDTQTAATTVANLQAIGLAQGDLRGMINSVIGAWATYGDSIPIDGLSEAVNETIQAGKVTGVFADVLNWAGVSEDEFNEKLAAANGSAERAQIVLNQLANQNLPETGKAWRDANEDVVAYNESQMKLDEAMGELGETLAPVAAGLKEVFAEGVYAAADAVSWLIDKIQTAINWLKSLNDGISNSKGWKEFTTGEHTPSSDYQALLDSYKLNGSHAAGLNYVPFDGYRAELHAGEAILNAQEAALWRTAGRTGALSPQRVSVPVPLPASAQGGAQRESVTIDVTLELDGQTLARKQHSLNLAEAERRGPSLVKKG